MSRYANVAVDLTAESIDKPFTYRVPEGMTLSDGQRVLIPFGSRTLEGVVIGLTDECALDEARVKDVIRPLEGENAILPELMAVARRMTKAYHCTFADALRQMIPAEMRGGRVKAKKRLFAAVADAEIANALRDSDARITLLDALADGPVEVARLEETRPGARGILKTLEKRGAVTISDGEIRRAPYKGIETRAEDDRPLMPQQQAALDELTGALRSRGGRFLLHGVTGSGKTEVYIRLIRETLNLGRAAIVLVPEIALTPQMTEWFRARFGAVAAVLHSRLSSGERYDEWRRIRSGEARVVIGARSAVLAPTENLGVIVVDEEHESSYQSDRHPCYDAREIAKWRCEAENAVLVLGSATPSIASYMKTMPNVRPENRMTLLEMRERVMGRAYPEVEIVDMRDEMIKGNRSMFSASLTEALDTCLSDGRQAILFINRRGHSTFVSCRACGYVEKCANCDVSMVYHQWDGVLRCHYCGDTRAVPKECPECGSPYIRYFGAGTQKIEEAVKAAFPKARVLRVDADTTAVKDGHEKLLSAFRRREFDVMVGTQMIAKGLDFPFVTLVGVVAADMSLHVADYRSVERTYQLITQVAGRAGRADYPGRVIVQTYDPDHYGIRLAAKNDFRAFYMKEVDARRKGLYPPFTILARLLVSDEDELAAMNAATEIEQDMNEMLDSDPEYRGDTVQMRALEAPLKRIRGETRWEVFIKLYARQCAWAVLDHMEQIAAARANSGPRVELEINPQSML